MLCASADALIHGIFERKMSELHSTAQLKVQCCPTWLAVMNIKVKLVIILIRFATQDSKSPARRIFLINSPHRENSLVCRGLKQHTTVWSAIIFKYFTYSFISTQVSCDSLIKCARRSWGSVVTTYVSFVQLAPSIDEATDVRVVKALPMSPTNVSPVFSVFQVLSFMAWP